MSEAVFLGTAIFVCAGCQTFAPSQQQQLRAVEQHDEEINPELAAPVTVAGTLLYYVLCFLPFTQ
jgi:hypothetical protein